MSLLLLLLVHILINFIIIVFDHHFVLIQLSLHRINMIKYFIHPFGLTLYLPSLFSYEVFILYFH